MGGYEGRLVLAARIEQEAGAGLYNGAEAQLFETVRQVLGAADEMRSEGVEVVVIQGERHPIVAGLGDEVERVVEAMVLDAVGVVGEPQAHAIPRLSAARAATWRPGSR